MFVAQTPSNFQRFYFASKIFRSFKIIGIICEIDGMKNIKQIHRRREGFPAISIIYKGK